MFIAAYSGLSPLRPPPPASLFPRVFYLLRRATAQNIKAISYKYNLDRTNIRGNASVILHRVRGRLSKFDNSETSWNRTNRLVPRDDLCNSKEKKNACISPSLSPSPPGPRYIEYDKVRGGGRHTIIRIFVARHSFTIRVYISTIAATGTVRETRENPSARTVANRSDTCGFAEEEQGVGEEVSIQREEAVGASRGRLVVRPLIFSITLWTGLRPKMYRDRKQPIRLKRTY